ncbi:MAG: 1-acyl-sn-glycerol-3-phosphate acyltransferase [Bacteroidales bacterium]|nr:1-acyl-sn-glycerol-3-phosphate acyltransferase [Bacteroidales bacterium]
MDIIKSIIVWLLGIGILIILFPLTFIIWVLVLPFDRERAVTHWLLIYQGLILSRLLPIWNINIEGREKAVRGTTYVIISNHQSILDVILLNCLRYKFKWISKIENVTVPVLGWYLRMADYITVNRGDEESKTEMLEKSYRCLKRGISIMMFPEGTRSRDYEIGVFKRGAFELAIQAEVPILPVLIDGTGGVLPKHGVIFCSGHHVRIRVLDPVNPASFNTENPYDLATRFRSVMISELKDLRTTVNNQIIK